MMKVDPEMEDDLRSEYDLKSLRIRRVGSEYKRGSQHYKRKYSYITLDKNTAEKQVVSEPQIDG